MKVETKDTLVALFVLAAMAGVVLFALGAYNAWAYGDWRCAFKKCVTVEVKQQ